MRLLKHLAYPALALAMVCGTGQSGFADELSYDNNDPITATIAGYSSRGMVSVLGEGQAVVVREAYPGSNVVYEPGNPAGSFVAVANGDREFALETVIEMQAAIAGSAPFSESYDGKFSLVTALSPNRTLVHIYGRAKFLDDNNITSLADIKERQIPVRLGINRPGNLWVRAHVDAILAEYGMTKEDIVSWGGTLSEERTGATIGMMKDARVDIEITGGFVPIGAFIELNTVTPIRFIPMSKEVVQGTADRLGIVVGVIPGGSYAFSPDDQWTPASTHYIIAGPSATDEEVYKLAKALDTELAAYHAMHPALATITRDEIVPNVAGIPLHPAAKAYYDSRE
jgi:TRAP transporter TAXI family solute receptor